jgi:FMN phosphatase YigB (HAD superfamily)
MAEYETVKTLQDLDTWNIAGTRLITLDAENVMTPYGDPTLFDGVLDWIKQRQLDKVNVAVATNNKNPEFVGALREELEDLAEEVPVFSGLVLPNKKKSPRMFKAAADHFEVGPAVAAHVDDQFLSLRGARMAGFGKLILAKPVGPNGHKGVKLGRPLDAAARIIIGLKQEAHHFATDGIDG